jgi:hypothetical protein
MPISENSDSNLFDLRVMAKVREFEETKPREDFIIKSWALCIALAERMALEGKRDHLERILETEMIRLTAWSIVFGKLPA